MIKTVIRNIDIKRFEERTEAIKLATIDLISGLVVNKLLRASELGIIAKENEVSINELIMCAFEQDYFPGF